jgi:hypothetical protein
MKKVRSIFTALLLVVFLVGMADANAQKYPSRFLKNKVNTVEFYWSVQDSTTFSTSADYAPIFYDEAEDLLVTEVVVAMLPNAFGDDTLSINIVFSDTVAAVVPTELYTSDFGLSNTDVGESFTTFTNATITPGQFIWVEVEGITANRDPNGFVVTMKATKQD